MAATNYALLIAKIRLGADDPATGQLGSMDTPDGRRDGANTLFKLHATNILSGTINGQQCGPWYTYGTGLVRSLTGFTLSDAINGYVAITAPPDASTTFPFFFDYSFLWFQDADYTTMIDEATEELGYALGTATPEGLYPALISLVLWRYWRRRASQWAIRYGSSAGGASDTVKSVCEEFRALAKDARDAAMNQKTGQIVFYMRASGQRDRPSSYTVTQGISPRTPPR